MERRWRQSGIPSIYARRNGLVSRKLARNVRALLYPKPVLPTGRLDGCNFAAVAAIRVRDAGIKIAAQVLIYGALRGAGGGGKPDIAYMYFGPDLGAEVRKAIEASPMLGELRGVAPAIIGVACATTVIRTASPTQRSCARLACRSSIARIQYSTTLTSCAMI